MSRTEIIGGLEVDRGRARQLRRQVRRLGRCRPSTGLAFELADVVELVLVAGTPAGLGLAGLGLARRARGRRRAPGSESGRDAGLPRGPPR